MHLLDGKPVYSAGDLVGFLACEHLTDLERAALAGNTKRPIRDDPEIELIRKRGFEHEARYKAQLEADGRRVTTIRPDTWDDQPDGAPMNRGDLFLEQVRLTREAITRGDDVIYQAAMFDGSWRGHADFLLRVDGPGAGSDLGDFHYEIADTKLARSTKASALLQLCTYVDLLSLIQGRPPDYVEVALGGSSRRIERHRVADYLAYYRSIKARFEATVTSTSRADDFPPSASSPDPVEHCDVCRWIVVCKTWWRQNDSLSLVAGINRGQRAALSERGYKTRRELAALPLPLKPRLRKGAPESLVRVRDQAQIQVQGEDAGAPRYELLAPDQLDDGTIVPKRGLSALPDPSPTDVFFDIEGDPFAFDDGLEYLFGVVDETGYRYWWALKPEDEQAAFEGVVDYLVERRRADPTMHVYHYGAYERGRMAQLSTRHATREEEVDELLRGGAFVDLYSIVRQSVRASVESYSIKRLEPFYGYRREIELQAANESIVEFERYLEDGNSDPGLLEQIRLYNQDDCQSTKWLRDWLEGRRLEAQDKFGLALPRPAPVDGVASEEVSRASEEVASLAADLTADIAKSGPTTDDQSARFLLANLLDWHRREAKSGWWRFFDLMSRPDDELLEEREPIAGLEFVEEVPKVGKQTARRFRYRFPPQENKVDGGSGVHDPRLIGMGNLGEVGTVETIDQAAGTLVMTRDPDLPHPTALVPLNFYRTESHRQALLEVGRQVVSGGLHGDGAFRAARDLLTRQPPHVIGQKAPGELLKLADETGAEAALRLVTQLDQTTLSIQGPPGSGKSSAGARMVLALVEQGKTVGVTATSHKVITTLLEKIREEADRHGSQAQAIHCVNKPGQGRETSLVKLAGDAGEIRAKLVSGDISIAAGTSWLWTNPKMRSAVDVLFVDEAGQISLANALAVSVGARSLVLLGDPQQLDQPIQGSHPDGADVSALEHLLGESQTIDPAGGLFLESTWRLHPDICRFTSEVFYAGELWSRPGLDAQLVEAGALGGTGLRWLPVEHRGNTSRSDEEAAVVVRLARRLVEGDNHWIDVPDGGGPVRKTLTWQDVLIVAPYNDQVGAIRERLPEEARDRVGTVDKFQGQQGAVVICSLTTSSPEDAPHGMEFLYSLNRLNVATSRAKCLAIIVANPDLVRVRCHTPGQMKLANGLCRFIELAQPMAVPLADAAGPTDKPVQLDLVLA